MAEAYVAQKLRVEPDGFSFGSSCVTGVLLLLAAAFAFIASGSYVYRQTASSASLVMIGFGFASLVFGVPCYLRGMMRGVWLPSWGASKSGLVLAYEYSFGWRRVAWADVLSITLREYDTGLKRRSWEADSPRKCVVIQLRRPLKPADSVEWLFHRFPILNPIPANVIVKRYCGASQGEVVELLGRYVPLTVKVETPGDPSPEETFARLSRPSEPLVRCAGEHAGDTGTLGGHEETCVPPSERLKRWMPQNGDIGTR